MRTVRLFLAAFFAAGGMFAAEEAQPRTGGIRPWTIDMSHLREAVRTRAAAKPSRTKRLLKASAPEIPSRWDSRELGLMTPVKDQNPYGTCWAFATCAALETALIKAGDTNDLAAVDLSENHLAAHDIGFLLGYNDGGNNQLAAALLASWRDPLLESQDPYARPESKTNAPPVRHVQEIVWLPQRRSIEDGPWDVDAKTDNAAVDETLKKAVMDYGAVAVCYCHMGAGYDASRGSYYSTSATAFVKNVDGGHAVTLIGWDDDYPAANFKTVPPANGAFLCKNSWGAGAGDSGYLWVSYYDEYFCYQTAAAYPCPSPTNNFGRVYEYDPCGQVVSWNVYETDEDQARGGKTNWCANVFTAAATGIVEAVGFYALTVGTEYEICIYTNCVSSPETGVACLSQTGTVANAGFTTVRLKDPVPILYGTEKFAVAMRLETPGYDYPLPVCSDFTDSDGVHWCTNTANAGESFLSPDGVKWTDFQDFAGASRTENLCIKAYTKFGADGDERELIRSVRPSEGRIDMHAGETASFSVTPNGGTEVTVRWELDGDLRGTGAAFDFTPSVADHGARLLACRVTDGVYTSMRTWTLSVSATLQVDASSTCDDPDGTPEKPFPSLADAVAHAVAGDEFIVAPGTYIGQVTPSVPMTIRSVRGPESTFIDASGGGWCYYAYLAQDAVLSGFTLQNASRDGYYGGGAIYGVLTNCVIRDCRSTSGGGAARAMLESCVIENCTASYQGGGVYDCVLVNCTLAGSSAQHGGGMYGSDLTFCVISNCTASGSGGAACYGVLDNCLVVGNTAAWDGGGAYNAECYSSTLAGNSAGRYGGGAVLDEGAVAVNSLVASNESLSGDEYSPDLKVYPNRMRYRGGAVLCTPSGIDARFVDPAHGDWRLRFDSPAIDTGTNLWQTTETDLDGNARISGAHIDAGCYERVLEVPNGWPVPQVDRGASAADEAQSVSNELRTLGFSAETAGAVKHLAEYAALGEWASAHNVARADLVASGTALLSSALGADGLLALESDDVKITSLESDGAGWRFTLGLEAYDSAKVNAALLKAAVGVKGAAELSGPWSAEELDVSVSPGVDAVSVTVTPPPAVTNYFLKAAVR